MRLVAGSVNRVTRGPAPSLQAKGAMRMMASESLAAVDQPVAVAEVQVYTLPGRIDLLAGAEEKASLFPSVRVAVEKFYHLSSPVNAHVRGPVGAPQRRHPTARLSFANDASNGLGIPLPRGALRVYAQGLLLGEDRLAHTPKGETVRVTTGQAYDIVVRRKRTDYRVQGLPKGTSEVAYELSLRNAKSEGVTVEATELMAGDWRILSESLPHRRESDRRAVWRIAVPADGQAVLRYRVRTKFR